MTTFATVHDIRRDTNHTPRTVDAFDETASAPSVVEVLRSIVDLLAMLRSLGAQNVRSGVGGSRRDSIGPFAKLALGVAAGAAAALLVAPRTGAQLRRRIALFFTSGREPKALRAKGVERARHAIARAATSVEHGVGRLAADVKRAVGEPMEPPANDVDDEDLDGLEMPRTRWADEGGSLR